ncbi:MAG: nuclear transport factor 2 family protein [Polyangiaceae bacterium]|nr:nuclear transport factor 2 family protein [Polyangiaceae bacterium]
MPTLPERIMTLFATYHIRRDKVLDDIDALYAPDVRFIDPFNDVVGKDHFMRITRNLNARVEEMRFDDLELVGDDPHFVITWTCKIKTRVGLTLTAPGVSELRSQGGLVTLHRDHWDALGAMAGSIPFVRSIYPRLTRLVFDG